MMRKEVLLDSKEGMEILFAAARAGSLVLNEWHERTAKKHGVSTEGVIISRALDGIPIRRANGRPVRDGTKLYYTR